MLEINTQKLQTLLLHVDEKVITVYFRPSLVFLKTIVIDKIIDTGYSLRHPSFPL